MSTIRVHCLVPPTVSQSLAKNYTRAVEVLEHRGVIGSGSVTVDEVAADSAEEAVLRQQLVESHVGLWEDLLGVPREEFPDDRRQWLLGTDIDDCVVVTITIGVHDRSRPHSEIVSALVAGMRVVNLPAPQVKPARLPERLFLAEFTLPYRIDL
ncbi:hypothetical protein ACFPVT_07350 [Corynebacterium choanae]|uniref:Uncharacterized protein n=1 Tax=Corynebacterium choanae TaxID=1862358 RepID=A0A3G6JCM9_9CORY|nr:hypothetical protein [Corynebacterium choanae]AZA13914.1 hypothetical protein CCHOA_07610 [Corynebacterium choanae]